MNPLAIGALIGMGLFTIFGWEDEPEKEKPKTKKRDRKKSDEPLVSSESETEQETDDTEGDATDVELVTEKDAA